MQDHALRQVLHNEVHARPPEPMQVPLAISHIVMWADRGVRDDPMIRQKLAWCHGKVEVMRYLGMRTLTRTLAGDRPGLLSSIARVFAKYDVNLHAARVNTLGQRAEDVFVIDGPILFDPKTVLSLETNAVPSTV